MAGYPVINGHKYSWASIEVHIVGQGEYEFTEITYSSKCEPGKVRGAGMRILGRTRGEAEHEGSITMLKAATQSLFARLGGNGFMLKAFNISVSYSETGEGDVKTDELIGCRIKSIEDAPKQGADPATVKLDLDIVGITYNKLDPFKDKP